jgi:hypothetical protein
VSAGRAAVFILAAVAGWGVGYYFAAAAFGNFGSSVPYPHVVPKTENGVSLRFAMVHDVLHERFPRHGRAYYLERNRLTQKALDAGQAANDPAASDTSPFVDDLAVGLEFAGEHEEAVRLLRDKLKRQLERGAAKPELYSTYANLGTFLILGPFRQVRPGNEEDNAILREGLAMIETAVEINPDSHFGREAWQAAIIKFMIDLYENPQTLLKVDMIGNSLGDTPHSQSPMIYNRFLRHLDFAFQARDYLAGTKLWAECAGARSRITRLHLPNEKTAPFDEPTLGIIGMWRLGGGAHPYFAVALGETMLRVNQPYLAWSAFERASRMADLVWPDAQLQREFRGHCENRQALIERDLPADEVSRLRPAFEKELAFGQSFQKDYEAYEAAQIAAGKSIDDPSFYDTFWFTRPPIASPVRSSDWFQTEPKGWAPSIGGLFAGAFVFAVGFLMRLRDRRSA